MPKTRKGTASKRGGQLKPPDEKKSVVVTVKFTAKDAIILARAARRRFIDRSTYCRMRSMESAYKDLGLEPPDDPEN